MVWEAATYAVYVTEQDPLESVQLAGVNVPVPLLPKLTVPVGVEVVPGDVSVTVAVHVLFVLTAIEEGEQLTAVLVVLVVTVSAKVPELAA